MIRTPEGVRIEGIRPNNVGGWTVVGSRQDHSVVPGRYARTVVLIREFTGPQAKANAIDAAGTKRLVCSPIIED